MWSGSETQGERATEHPQKRYKSQAEFEIEERWREKLLQGGSTEDFQQAYDQLHREFLSRQGDDAKIYGEVNPRESGADRLRPIILRCIAPGSRVLEVGTGDGETAYWLAKQGCHVLATDVSTVSLESARERWGHDESLDLRFAFGDARSLGDTSSAGCTPPAEGTDSRFDYVLSENLVEHISVADMRQHLQQVRRVLAPGGGYLLYTPSRLWNGRVLVGFHLHNYTLRELIALLREYGFRPAWIEPRLLHRLGLLWAVSGLGLRLACAYEWTLEQLHVHTWPVSIKARIIPTPMILARVDGAKRTSTGSAGAR